MRCLLMFVAAVVVTNGSARLDKGTPNAQLKGFQPMVGRWFIDDTRAPADVPELGLKQGDSVKRFAIVKSEVLDSLITSDIVLEVKGQPPVLVWRETIAWDPAAKALRSTAIGYTKELKSRYVYATGNWKSEDNALIAEYSGVMGDGHKNSWKVTYKLTGKDRLSVAVTDRVRAGESLENESREHQRVECSGR